MSSQSTNTNTVLVWGASRGVGLSLLEQYAQKPNVTVIAAVRPSSKLDAIKGIQPAQGSQVLILTVDVADFGATKAKVEEFAKQHKLTAIDVVIANGGYLASQPSFPNNDPAPMLQEYSVNALGPLSLYNATVDLMSRSTKKTFAIISSQAASSASMAIPFRNDGYAASKAAANAIGLRLHYARPEITVLLLHPGLVETDMATANVTPEQMKDFGSITSATSAEYLEQTIEASSNKDGGRFIDVTTGQDLPF